MTVSNSILKKVREIVKTHKLFNSAEYKGFRAKHSGNFEGIKLPAAPWTCEHKSTRAYFKEIEPGYDDYGRPIKNYIPCRAYVKIQRPSFEEHLEYARENNITSAKEWHDNILSAAKGGKKFYKIPWNAFKISIDDFFSQAYPRIAEMRRIKKLDPSKVSIEQHIRMCVENKLHNSKSYRMFYLANRDRIDLLARPWDRLSLTEHDFFEPIRKAKESAHERLEYSGSGNKEEPIECHA
jgi:hypothetical protein